MNEISLLNEYQALYPGFQKIYVVPNIFKVGENNPYMELLYAPFFKNEYQNEFKIKTFSFVSPLFVLRRIFGEKSLVHHHWYEFRDIGGFLNLIWKTSWMWIYKQCGGKIVWTVHNKYPHEERYLLLNKRLRKIWARIPDKIHVHCQEAVKIMSEILEVEKEKFFVVSHPRYPATIIDRKQAFRELDLKYLKGRINPTDLIFLMFGYIAQYKGILEVIKLFRFQDRQKKLVIAGPVKIGNVKYSQEINKNIMNNDNIILIDQLIPENDVSLFFNAADYILFNYKDILISGTVMLALSYGKKVIIPNTGCLVELTGEYIIKFSDLLQLKKIINELN